jgi:hypothetical protein
LGESRPHYVSRPPLPFSLAILRDLFKRPAYDFGANGKQGVGGLPADETNCIAFPHFLIRFFPEQLGQLLPPLLSVHDKGSQSFAFIAAGKSNGEVSVAVGTGTMVVWPPQRITLAMAFWNMAQANEI